MPAAREHPERHYRKTLLCCVPAAHGETMKPHSKPLAVSQHTANTIRRRRPRRRTAKL
jgi:hypothetical protein